MEIGVLIKQVAESWPAYLSKERVDKTDPVYDKVVNGFQRSFRQQRHVEADGEF